ncbi:HEPN domain-containing protein [Burkholderia sp. BCC1985]|uniref:HEPN domain-containing protein n=1 Tax=Burkholderia sp. BCC1985 TaxID=2817442 RepID=UPI002AB06BA5|nr:HEPN domain-containing protein [Burkholderia sp. BCC1985]
MNFKELIRKTTSCVDFGTREQALTSVKAWFGESYTLYVTDGENYLQCLEDIYDADKLIAERFSRETIYKFINKRVAEIKLSGEEFNQELNDFFKFFYSITPKTISVVAPISGIRLDGGARSFDLSIFRFGHLADLSLPIANQDGMYVSVGISEIYDNTIAIAKAEVAFLDFARLVVFFSGKLDQSIRIRTGLPLYVDLSHEQMYVNTSSYQILDKAGNPESSSFTNKHFEKIPINNDFFRANEQFGKLWSLYETRHKGGKLTDIESRILNCALALGESAMTSDTRNSIIYTCISLEILLSFDEGSLFQKSIGEKLSDLFSFIVAKDRDSRLFVGKLLKKVYGMRSAIVHGGEKKLSNENLSINMLVRAGINDLLNGDRFVNVTKISQLYEQLKIAQNSY